jgi:hypothetical protein
MAEDKKKGFPGVAIVVGHPTKSAEHAEPDADQEGGESDGDADNLPAGALEAFKEYDTAEGDDAKASALATFCKLVCGGE